MSAGNPVYFGIKRSNVKVTRHKSNAGVGLCTLLIAGFFSILLLLLFFVLDGVSIGCFLPHLFYFILHVRTASEEEDDLRKREGR